MCCMYKFLIACHIRFCSGSFRAGLSSVVLKLAQVFASVASYSSSPSSTSFSEYLTSILDTRSSIPGHCMASLVLRFKELLAVGRPVVKIDFAVERLVHK